MSIAVLNQVYDEMRRLAIAGSSVAVGDFRLKKLLPPLEQAGAKAPVFARVAEAVKGVVESNEKTAPNALLELTALVNAILFTQGETGLPGTLADVETTEMTGAAAQTSARVLKPLLEALTTTGSGRLELIRDAHERNLFRDLRLVKPALDALDDPFPEIADLVAEKILPMYGKAIASELRARLDIKGKAGHPRRMRLLHTVDPDGARELVMQALEGGSKEVKVAAIECMGRVREDLSFLIEQASAKAQDVRQAAYRALAGMNEDEAVAVLRKAMVGKELEVAAHSLRTSRNVKLLQHIIEGTDQEIDALLKLKDKKEVSPKVTRIQTLLWCLHGRTDPASEAFLLKLFGLRPALEKIKGTALGGTDLNQQVAQLMHVGSDKLKVTLAEAHAALSPDEFRWAFASARQTLPPARVYDMFSPYIKGKGGKKKDGDAVRHEAICSELGGHNYYWRKPEISGPADPRWLDVALGLEHLGMILALAHPGHARVNLFLKERFEERLKKSKDFNDCFEVLSPMVYCSHPEATDAVVRCLEKHAGNKTHSYHWWFAHLLPELPKSAIPKLEAIVPSLPDWVADSVVTGLQQLRDKKEA